ncbi:sugar phosphate isomerase/epimerase family protein [Youngiibacter fragilis]|uniref:Xylose isomerase n=1 Tax=Youngiibacter fragilis 232.1 TaxID=994573 RepID=V7I346_9CLOT|nr:sugar phosphate isomerase/epimerase family protein [Youngiibacter fragilis]ETA80660.1 xylose isomerase [Youngiibacter fragilis 232.1]
MRFGCCLNMVSTGTDGTGIENIEKLKEAGFDYVELPLAELTRLTDTEREDVVGRLNSSGMSCEVCNNMFPKTFRLTGPDVRIDEVLAYAEKALHIAGSIGAKSVVFGSGPAKMVPEGFPLDEGYRQVVDLLKLVDPIAGRNGITIAIEPLRKAECNLINTFEEGVRLAEDVGGENIKVLVDYYHLTVEDESPEKVRKYGKGSLVHVHMANPDGRVFPKAMDESDYRPFFNALGEIGYKGRVSCEAYSENFSEDAPSTLRFFRDNMTQEV